MKSIYFDKGKKEKSDFNFSKISLFTTYGFTKIFPSLSARLATKVLLNPFSKRDYNFKTNIQPETINLKIDMGNLVLHYFKGGDKHIFLSHGWADSSARFTSVINELLSQGFSVWSLDHIGHGKSEGNASHLFGYILGIEKSFSYIKSKGIDIMGIVTHSMGGVAMLNMQKEFLKNKKMVLVSVPGNFFESMFEKVKQSGISKLVLENLLNTIGEKNNLDWKAFNPDLHKEKIANNFLFVHDVNDSVANYSEMRNLITSRGAKLLSTSGLGHVRILRDKKVLEEISTFLNR